MGAAALAALALLVAATAACASRNDAFVGYSEGPLHFNAVRQASLFEEPDHLIFATDYGDVKVELASTAAPETVSFIQDLAVRGVYDGCSFYRAEPPGDTFDQGSTVARKGYALVQGGLYACGKQKEVNLPVESRWKNTKGSVSLITGTNEFFFNLEDHPEWDGSFSVWGKVASNSSFQVLQKIAVLPTRQEVHPTGTVMRMLRQQVQFFVRKVHPVTE